MDEFFVVGGQILDATEFRNLKQDKNFQHLSDEPDDARDMAAFIDLGVANVPVRDVARRLAGATGSVATEPKWGRDLAGGRAATPAKTRGGGGLPKFTPIEIGRPISIEIHHVYTGRYPRRGSRAMLVTSAIKGLEQAKSAPRALNLLEPTRSKCDIAVPLATHPGTRLVYYQPALTGLRAALQVDISFERIDNESIQRIGGYVIAAGGIPLFAPLTGYLLGVGIGIRIVGRLLKTFRDRAPECTFRSDLALDRVGTPILESDFRLCIQEEVGHEVRKEYRVNSTGQLVHRASKEPYNGDALYVVLAVNGAEVAQYNEFQPAIVTADILSRFEGAKSLSEAVGKEMFELARLSNDMYHRKMAEHYSELHESATEAMAKELHAAKRDAAVKNIMNDIFKPSF